MGGTGAFRSLIRVMQVYPLPSKNIVENILDRIFFHYQPVTEGENTWGRKGSVKSVVSEFEGLSE